MKKKKHSIALDDFKAWREKSGLRQVDLAHLLSTTQARVSQMETGQAGPNAEELLGMSFIYGKSLEVLVASLLDRVAYRLIALLRRMPKVSANWALGESRAKTLTSLARRLETYNDGRV